MPCRKPCAGPSSSRVQDPGGAAFGMHASRLGACLRPTLPASPATAAWLAGWQAPCSTHLQYSMTMWMLWSSSYAPLKCTTLRPGRGWFVSGTSTYGNVGCLGAPLPGLLPPLAHAP